MKRVRMPRSFHRVPMNQLPTWLLVRTAVVFGSVAQAAEARLALKDRRLELLAQLKLVEEAEVTLQRNIFDAMRRRGRLRARRRAIAAAKG
ncbi:hypothetical protein [Methylobacterium indicum]|uniref:Uncharacterized protein n=1 Tax=Methylobacterium indicum TaxID=1775910 RepID=A0A8H8WZZ0_9HYPH|nr:hypothetical protein [Methylobacterium indicum]BCM87790.1 hypothetical protein mvi_62510 [Methylobacterium indicum]